jgi:hypothetical protein
MKTTQTELMILALIMIFGEFGATVFEYAAVEAAKSRIGVCASTLKNASAQFCPKGP